MSYKITYKEFGDYLYCYVEGKDTQQTTLGFWLDIAAKVRDLGYDKVLVEEDLEGEISITELYEVLTQGAEMEMIGFRIAFFDRHADHDEVNQFGETVAKNRGIDGRVFTDIEEAKTWLLQE